MSELVHAQAMHRDYKGAKLGMWLFLFTELVLFSGLFLSYLVYHGMYPEAFKHAASELNVTLGATNTIILLTSSLTMVLSITALQKGRKGKSIFFLALTVLCALGFLVIKYFEWGAKIHHGIYPGSEHLATLSHGEQLFFGLYYTMTGLHGFHVLVGMVALIVSGAMVKRDAITQHDFIKLENVGLYWHLVDLIWIYLFPLLYLVK